MGEESPLPSPGGAPQPRGRPWQLWVATLFGAGMLPKMPGTYGSAVAALLTLPFVGSRYWTIAIVAEMVIYCVACVALGGWVQRFLGRKDPGPMVLDEGAGVCLTLLTVPMRHGAWVVLVAFAAFRVFDVTKPPPARQLERLPEGWGILCDDLAAAVYANLVLQALFRWVIP